MDREKVESLLIAMDEAEEYDFCQSGDYMGLSYDEIVGRIISEIKTMFRPEEL